MQAEVLVRSRAHGHLRSAIRAADAAYRAGKAYLSDAEFDELMAELEELEPSAPELLTPGGGSKLLSLDKQDLSVWLAGLGAAAVGRFSVTPKIDGWRQVSDAKAAAAPQKQPLDQPLDQPLTPAVITALQERIKALKPTARASFSTAFRAAFQVPPEQPSLAGLITTTRHQRWIEAFLAEGASA